MATILYANGNKRDVEPKNGTDFTLEELHEIVDGYIEVVSLGNGQILVLDEEGKLKEKKPNYYATKIASQARAIDIFDWIVGDVLLCGNDEVK